MIVQAAAILIRHRLKILGAVLMAALLVLCSGSETKKIGAEPKRKKPNVLFIFVDQLRLDALSIHGQKNIATPHMDKLARQGMRFTNALSTTPLCTPYRAMLVTGRYPTHSGVLINWIDINPKQRSIAHVFDDTGYSTGFIGKWHLAAGFRKHTGILTLKNRKDQRIADSLNKEAEKKDPDSEFVPPGPERMGFQHWAAFNFHVKYEAKVGYYYRDKKKKNFFKKWETDELIDLSIDYMNECKKEGKPFFLMVAPHPPHPPFKKSLLPKGYWGKVPEKLQKSANVPDDHPYWTGNEARCYFAMTKVLDDSIGRLMKYLDDTGLAKNTIVILTSDHGSMLGSHNTINKMKPYAEAVNIPLLIRWPGKIKANQVTDALQTPLDHMATLCGLLGKPVPKSCDGRDLSGVLLGAKKDKRDAVFISNYSANWNYFVSSKDWYNWNLGVEWRGVKTKRYTYAKFLNGKEWLFDDKKDPNQMKDLSKDENSREVLNDLRAKMEAFLKEAHDDFRPGDEYAEWYDKERNLVKTGLGPVKK